MRKKQTVEPHTIIDPAYWHLLSDEERLKAEKDLEDTLEAALDEGSVEANDEFWADLDADFIERVTELESAGKAMNEED